MRIFHEGLHHRRKFFKSYHSTTLAYVYLEQHLQPFVRHSRGYVSSSSGGSGERANTPIAYSHIRLYVVTNLQSIRDITRGLDSDRITYPGGLLGLRSLQSCSR